MTVADIVAMTIRVVIENVALDDPAGTVTLVATLSGSPPDKDTSTPLVGAGADNVTVALTGLPPTTVEALNESDDTIVTAVTVKVED